MATRQRSTGRTIDWATIVRKREGKDLKKPEVVYKFTGGRTFTSTDRTNHGFYSGTST